MPATTAQGAFGGRRLGQRATILRSENLLDTGLGASAELFADRGNGVWRAISGNTAGMPNARDAANECEKPR
jgi:hypothetical protein